MKAMKIINDKLIEQEHLSNSVQVAELDTVGDCKIVDNNKRRQLMNYQDRQLMNYQDQCMLENQNTNNDTSLGKLGEEKKIDSSVQDIQYDFLTPIYHPESKLQKHYEKKRKRSIMSTSSVVSNITTSTTGIDNINSINITTITNNNDVKSMKKHFNNMFNTTEVSRINEDNNPLQTNHLSKIASFLTTKDFWDTLQFMNDESKQKGYDGDNCEEDIDDEIDDTVGDIDDKGESN